MSCPAPAWSLWLASAIIAAALVGIVGCLRWLSVDPVRCAVCQRWCSGVSPGPAPIRDDHSAIYYLQPHHRVCRRCRRRSVCAPRA